MSKAAIMLELVDLLSNTFNWRLEKLEAELLAARAKVAELESKIESDPLLDIPNRRGFERELKRALVYVQRYQSSNAVIFIDLDDFKAINDRSGHLAGDAVLKAVSAAIVGELRASDIVARFGGDEFAILLWNLSESSAHAKALKLENTIASLEIRCSTESLSIGASAGMTMLNAIDHPSDVMGRADANMYSRKQRAIRSAAQEKIRTPRMARVGFTKKWDGLQAKDLQNVRAVEGLG
jgi:diguanylate cyclase (GGDEF)-like protein